MPLIHPQGSPSARIWFVFDAPFPTDVKKGYMCSGGAGYVFTKMLQEAGITDYYIIARRPDSDAPDYAQNLTEQIARHKVPFIVPLGAAGQHICKTLLPLKSKDGKEKQSWKTPLSKYVGSLLECNGVMHKNYLMPIYGVDVYIQDWQERQVVTYFDLQKLGKNMRIGEKVAFYSHCRSGTWYTSIRVWRLYLNTSIGLRDPASFPLISKRATRKQIAPFFHIQATLSPSE